MDYQTDRTWADRFIPRIKQIVGPLLLVGAPFEMDTKRAADLILLRADSMHIAARMRRPGYAARYPNDFTIRSARDNGCPTELSKIIRGFGDWFFYGHSSEDEIDICQWMVLDLDVFRANLIEAERRDEIKRHMHTIDNGDGTYGLAFDVNNFSPDLVIASS